MLEKLCFCQQKIIQTNDIKCLDSRTNNKEPQKELTESEPVILSVNTAKNEQTDISDNKKHENDPSHNTSK